MINPTIKEFWITKNTFHILPALLIRFDDVVWKFVRQMAEVAKTMAEMFSSINEEKYRDE